MPLANVTAQIDPVNNILIPINTGTWGNLSNSSWSNWTGWVNAPANPMVWNLPVQDLESNVYFTITTDAQVNGNIIYLVKTSTTGNFAGEETTTTITSADTSNVSAFYGRFVYIQANVYNQGGQTSISSLNFTTSTRSYDITLTDIDSTTLTANGTGRILPIDGNTIGAVKAISITPFAGSGGSTSVYVTAGYVDSDYFESTTTNFPPIPLIVGKNRSSPTVQFVDYTGAEKDCVFDARVTVVPQMGYSGQNLVVL
jgi:hypothetical protein